MTAVKIKITYTAQYVSQDAHRGWQGF